MGDGQKLNSMAAQKFTRSNSFGSDDQSTLKMASYDNVIEKSVLSTENRSIEKIFEKSIHYFFVDMLKSFNDSSKVMNKESIRLVNIFDRLEENLSGFTSMLFLRMISKGLNKEVSEELILQKLLTHIQTKYKSGFNKLNQSIEEDQIIILLHSSIMNGINSASCMLKATEDLYAKKFVSDLITLRKILKKYINCYSKHFENTSHQNIDRCRKILMLRYREVLNCLQCLRDSILQNDQNSESDLWRGKLLELMLSLIYVMFSIYKIIYWSRSLVEK